MAGVEVYCAALDRWDGPLTERRKASGYKAAWETVIDELTHEAKYLECPEVVLGLNVGADAIRITGWPKAQATVPPAVAVMLTASNVGPLRFQCDRWATWQENVRAVVLTLTRLRQVAEGGVATSGEQYRGWAQLGTGAQALPAPEMSPELAAEFLAKVGAPDGARPQWADLLNSPALQARCYRYAARKLHPDTNPGVDPALYHTLNQARDVLDRRGA